jgi:hypothetical protein
MTEKIAKQQGYLSERDRRFHETTGIRLPDPSFTVEQHLLYDQLSYEIRYGYWDDSQGRNFGKGVPEKGNRNEEWLNFEEKPLLERLGGVLAIPLKLAKTF